MLIRLPVLHRIKSGEVTLAFRRWRRPTVKTGGTLHTAVGVLAISRVEKVAARRVSPGDAIAAGYASRAALMDDLATREGDLYRIALAYAGQDPRAALRRKAPHTQREIAEIRDRLRRLDAASRLGPWTRPVLAAIARHPKVAAQTLATMLGYERDWLKGNVRKLKNLGLTESHHPGYTLSPRGKSMLDHLPADRRRTATSRWPSV